MIKKIEYENKEGLQNDATIPDKNKVTDDDMNEIKEIVNTNADELGNKVDKEDGKGLSTNDYTNEEKEKLAGLSNYNDEEIKEEIATLKTEYTELQQDLEALTIKGQAEGESIDLYDSSSARVKSFEVMGNSKQDGEPSLDNRVEIKSAGDDINIFNKDTVVMNYYLNNNNEEIRNTSYCYSDYIDVSKSKNITISANEYPSASSPAYIFYDKDKTYINGETIPNSEKTIAIPNNAQYFRTSVLKTQLDSLKIQYGSKATPYSPYGQGTINEVVCNKNYLEMIPTTNDTFLGMDLTIGSNFISLSGVANGPWSSFSSKDGRLEIPKLTIGETYTLSVYSTFEEQHNINFWFDGKDGKTIQTVSILSKSNSVSEKIFTFTAEDVNRLRIAVSGFSTDSNFNGAFYFQIEEGSTGTDIAEHEEQNISIPVQQPMRAIGDVRDCFVVKEDGKRYERHNIARIESYNGEVINTEYMSTTGELSTGATVDYVLETPNDLECTSEQNTELDKLENLRSYKNITHIYSTDEVGAYVKVEYRKDLETYIMNNIQSSLETQTQNTISTIEEEGQE